MAETRKPRYDRIAGIYDLVQYPMERMFLSRLRGEVFAGVRGKVLEVGVGTGKSFPYYPRGVELTAIDISRKMLEHARRRADKLELAADIRVMDAEHLEFPDDTFDYVAATCVFCSVDDPVAGLAEIKRVLKPDGRVRLLEHVRSESPAWGRLMDWLNPIARYLSGANINRRTVENVEAAGLELYKVESRGVEILKLIEAGCPASQGK